MEVVKIKILTNKNQTLHHTQWYPDSSWFIQTNYEREDTKNQTDYVIEDNDEHPQIFTNPIHIKQIN